MGLFRKATSISTLGAVKYRTPNQRTARYAKKTYQLQKRQSQPSPAETIQEMSQSRLGRGCLYSMVAVVALFVLIFIVAVVIAAV
jgi:cell division protein FtsL